MKRKSDKILKISVTGVIFVLVINIFWWIKTGNEIHKKSFEQRNEIVDENLESGSP